MPDLSDRVAAALRPLIPSGCRLTVGYSGGLDSSVLLHVLAGLRGSLGLRLSAVHVHHGLSPRADAWTLHCESVCRILDVPLIVRRIVVEPAGEGPEAAARAARYREFEMLDTDALALAHHRDDQAETVLLQLLRGAGLKGLAAMPVVRRLGDVILIRPLLDVSRDELLVWARASRLTWVEDESNTDTRLSRNALRHRAIPSLSVCYPAATMTLAHAASQFAEASLLLDDLARWDADGALSPAGLALANLRALSEPRARNLLRHFLECAGVTIRSEGLREALRQALTARDDARVRVDFGSVSLYRHRGYLQTVVTRPPAAGTWFWRGEPSLELGMLGRLEFRQACGAGVRLEPSTCAVAVRLRRGGERMRLRADGPTRTLKNLLREAEIPPWRRGRLPMIEVDGALAWVADIGVDADFQVTPDETGWLISWQASPDTAV